MKSLSMERPTVIRNFITEIERDELNKWCLDNCKDPKIFGDANMGKKNTRLTTRYTQKDDLIFPFWDGRKESLRRTTLKLSRKWSTIAKLAGCDDLHWHDLRHEAVCRLYEKTKMTDLQIAKISGHKDLRMLKRYSNLRGSDLAEMMW